MNAVLWSRIRPFGLEPEPEKGRIGLQLRPNRSNRWFGTNYNVLILNNAMYYVQVLYCTVKLQYLLVLVTNSLVSLCHELYCIATVLTTGTG